MREHEMKNGESEAFKAGGFTMFTSKAGKNYHIVMSLGNVMATTEVAGPDRIQAMGSALYTLTKMYHSEVNLPQADIPSLLNKESDNLHN